MENIDLLEAEAKARFIELLPSDGPDSAFGDVETGE
jgi:hypothetical protein